MVATLFFGGWDIPFTHWDEQGSVLAVLVTLVAFFLKAFFWLFFFMWIRWTLPRFRYDQLMALGWKVMLPVALTYIVVVAGATYVLDSAGVHPSDWKFAVVMLVLNIVLMGIILGVLDRGRLISPAYSRLDKRNMEKRRRGRDDRAAGHRPQMAEGGD